MPASPEPEPGLAAPLRRRPALHGRAAGPTRVRQRVDGALAAQGHPGRGLTPHSLKRMAPVESTKKKVPTMREMMVVKESTITI